MLCFVFNDVLRFTPSLIIQLQVKFFNVKSDTALIFFCFVDSNYPIFVAEAILVPHNKLLDALIVGAVIVELVLPVIFRELIVPVHNLIFVPIVFVCNLNLNRY